MIEGPARRDRADRVSDLQEHRDRQLVSGIAAGGEDVFRALFRRYGPAAFGLAFRILGDRGYAEEVVQEVFVTIWQRAAGYDPARGSVRSWILTLVHHRAVDVVRREGAERRRDASATEPGEVPSAGDVIEEDWIASRRRRVRAALETLPADQRSVIELAYFDGLPQTQVALRAGIPLGTVKSRTLAAMRRLRAHLERGDEG